jgi:HemY protein
VGWFFRTLLIFLVAVAAAAAARQDPGYLMIQFRGWTIETSLLFAVLFLVIGFLVLYASIRLFIGARDLSPRFLQWSHRRRRRAALRTMTRGYIELMEGRSKKAEKCFLDCTEVEDGAMLSYLGAARAAQAQGAGERRDEYLRRASEAMPKAEVALALAQAEMQIEDGRLQQARATLERLRGLAPRNAMVIAQLLRLYADLEDWGSLLALVAAARRRGLDESRIAALEQKALQAVRQHR